MYQYACMFFKLSIISSSIEIILFSDIRIFAFPLYPYYQELLLFKKAREWGGGLIRRGGVACMMLWSKGRALIGACALIIRGNAVMVVSVFCYFIRFFHGSKIEKGYLIRVFLTF